MVDDEASVRQFVCIVLRKHGYEVLEADDAAAAMAVAGRHPGPIALLVCDLGLPGVDGRHLADALIAVRPALKVLFVSGHFDDDASGPDSGPAGSDFLCKPFPPAVLAAKIRDVLDRATPPVSPATPVSPASS